MSEQGDPIRVSEGVVPVRLDVDEANRAIDELEKRFDNLRERASKVGVGGSDGAESRGASEDVRALVDSLNELKEAVENNTDRIGELIDTISSMNDDEL